MDIRILLIAFKLLFTVKLDFHHFERGNFFEIFRRETWRRCAMVISTSLVGPPKLLRDPVDQLPVDGIL